jgi:hypothetical protein
MSALDRNIAGCVMTMLNRSYGRMLFLLLVLNRVNTWQLEHCAIQRDEEERTAYLTEIAYTDAECLVFVDEMSAKSRHFRRRLGRAM